MPLPDERPRASVANLIGRFEQQNKRNSLSAASSSPSRSSSVVSNITGDSAKEELKEKREWPPKSIVPDTPLAPPVHIHASAFWSKPKPVAAAADPPSNTTSDPGDTPTNVSSSPAKPVQSVEDAMLVEPPSSPTPQPHTAAQSPRSIKTVARTTGKPIARSSMASIQLQHSGQSTTSTFSPKPKVAPSTPRTPRSSGVPKTPSSARPKTPSSAAAGRPKTPAIHANRPKTPTSSTSASRPKTPSSGLFAPTAASLARARTGPPQPQVPTRKVTLSSAAAERLSKPTAASLSKARSASPAIQVKGTTSARGGSTTAIGGVKSKTTSSSPRKGVSSASTGRGVTSNVPKAATNGNGKMSHEEGKGVTTAFAEGVQHTEKLAEAKQENTNGEEVNEEVSGGEVHEDEIHVEEPHSEGETILESEGHSEVEHIGEPLPSEQESSTNPGPSPSPSADRPDESLPDHNGSSTGEGEVVAFEEESNAPSENDIEDMVKLLESGKPRPISVTNIPDELDVHEIPDEE